MIKISDYDSTTPASDYPIDYDYFDYPAEEATTEKTTTTTTTTEAARRRRPKANVRVLQGGPSGLIVGLG